MRIIIEIEGDESGATAHPTSITITFPQTAETESGEVQTVVEHAVEQQTVAEDAGPAPLAGATAGEPMAYVATLPQTSTDLTTTAADGGDVVPAGRSAVDAGTPPPSAFDAGAVVTGAATEPLRSAVDTGRLLFSTEAVAAGGQTTQEEPDDLTVIDGIGPKISRVLTDAGIITFERLATSEVAELQQILSDADVRAKVETWPGQAAVAATDDAAALETYQANLKAA